MHRFLISVFYKQQPERPTIDQLLHPENLQSGDRFTRVFQREMEFSCSSENDVLDELFATFNGHGQALPANISIPRSMSVGDIITGEKRFAFLVTPTGFERLPFPLGSDLSIRVAFIIKQINPSTIVIEEAPEKEKVRT